MKRPVYQLALTIFLYANITIVSATSFDGSKNLLCATFEVIDCGLDEQCERVRPDKLDLPLFIHLDFKNKEIRSNERAAKIEHVSSTNSNMILQGKGQEGRGWTVVLNKESGSITGGVVGENFVFTIFGACTIP